MKYSPSGWIVKSKFYCKEKLQIILDVYGPEFETLCEHSFPAVQTYDK